MSDGMDGRDSAEEISPGRLPKVQKLSAAKNKKLMEFLANKGKG
jgi:hypothetical protein